MGCEKCVVRMRQNVDDGVANGSDDYDCGCAMAPSGPGVMADLIEGDVEGTWTLIVV